MRIRIYAVEQDSDAETLVGVADALTDCLNAEDPQYAETERELAEYGVAYVGGGAAQLFKLVVEEQDFSLRKRSGGEGEPWRCLFCGDVLADGVDCPKPRCVEAQRATERRMGVRHA